VVGDKRPCAGGRRPCPDDGLGEPKPPASRLNHHGRALLAVEIPLDGRLRSSRSRNWRASIAADASRLRRRGLEFTGSASRLTASFSSQGDHDIWASLYGNAALAFGSRHCGIGPSSYHGLTLPTLCTPFESAPKPIPAAHFMRLR